MLRSLQDTTLEEACLQQALGGWGSQVLNTPGTRNTIPMFPISKLILSRGSHRLLIMRDLQAGRMASQEKSREVPLTCTFQVGLDNAPRNVPKEQVCDWEGKKQLKQSFQTHMSVIKFLLGEKGRETRTDLGKGWSNSFLFPHYRTWLVLSQWRDTTVNCQQWSSLTTCRPSSPQLQGEIQGEDALQAQERGSARLDHVPKCALGTPSAACGPHGPWEQKYINVY